MPGLSAVSWVQLTVTDLQNQQAGPLVSAFQGTALASGQVDPTVAILTQVTDEVLGSVGFSGRYALDASYKTGQYTPDLLPPNLKDMSVKKAVRILRGRLDLTLTPDQIQDERTYQMILQRLRDGKFPVDLTNNPSSSQVAVNPGLVGVNPGPPPLFSRCQLRNL